MNARNCLFGLLCFLAWEGALQAAPREWTSSGGGFKITAELVSFDDRTVKLKKADGKEVTVLVEKLSDADQKFLAEAAALTPSVEKFKAAMEAIRPVETKRIEKRLEELKEHLRSGAKEMKHPTAQEAKTLERSLTLRLKVIRGGEPFVPRLSPKDFQVGQIGELDDDLAVSVQTLEKDGSAYLSIVFDTIRHKENLGGVPTVWHHTTVSRPDRFHLRADFAAALPAGQRDFDRNSPTNRLLRSHVYEVIDKEPRGLAADYVLTPFKMDEVRAWMKAQTLRPAD